MNVFLLTSHPVAPPWNSGDKNLARTLLLGEAGVDFSFIGDRADPSPWPQRHHRVQMRSGGFAPSAVEKLRLFGHLLRGAPRADAAHLIVSFQSSRVTPRLLGGLPLLRERPFLATCPSGQFHPLPLLQRARGVVALSARTAKKLREDGVARVEHIPPGVDLERFTPQPVEDGWAHLDVGEGPFLLFAGHHDRFGGLEQALDVVAAVRRRVPAVRLIAAMRHRPSEDQADMRERLAAMVRERDLEGAVVELGGLANMLAAILAAHAVIFQPSRLGLKMELPLTLLEALACGRPVVVNDLETLPEIGGPPAVRVGDPGDPAVVDHLVSLLHDPGYFDECSGAARALAVERYDAAAMVRRYAELYRGLS